MAMAAVFVIKPVTFEQIFNQPLIIKYPWPLLFTEVHEAPSFITQSTTFLEKYNVSPFLHSKAQGTKFDFDKKIGQGQPRITIWINLVVLSNLKLQTKFQGNQLRGSGKKIFLRFLSYMGMVAILVIRPVPVEQISINYCQEAVYEI